MNILLTIQQNMKRLSPSAQKLAKYVLENPSEVTQLNTQELAETVGVSPATVVRFSKSMGLAGFTELKLKLAAVSGEDDQALIEEVTADETVKSIKQKLALRLNHMIEQTNQQLDDVAVERTVDLFDEHPVIYVYGIGASALVAQDIMQKFTRIGRYVFYTQDEHLLLSSMAVQAEKSLLIVISNSGETAEVIHLAQAAQELDITVVALTGNDDSTLAKLANQVMTTISDEQVPLRVAATISLMAQLYTVDILFYNYVSRYFYESRVKVKQSRQLVARLKRDFK
jgi:DNA-binding MurR/RpiR family transcriptional regulator